MTSHVCRFAPSPNGYLHLGHALSAIDAFETAQRLDGRFLLRIEDIDTARCREEFVTAIFEDLAWLGLTWETPVLRQSQHLERYRVIANKLTSLGVLYPCFATRSEIAGALSRSPKPGVDPEGLALYPLIHKYLSPCEIADRKARGESFALRLDMDKALTLASEMANGKSLTFFEYGGGEQPLEVEAAPERWGDVVISRKETPSSYHLSVVADDAFQGVTRVTRGRDLFAATGLHRLLQVLLDLPEPQYAHHRLLIGDDGRKLAKSAGDTSLREFRASGVSLNEVRASIGRG